MVPVRTSRVGRHDEWIVADIGGTHARFRRWTASRGLNAGSCARYRNDAFSSLRAVVDQYRRDSPSRAAAALLAIAAPIGPGPLKMTNLDWSFTADGLREDLELSQLRLVNDFVAAAAGIESLSADETRQIGGRAADSSAAVVLGPGTGLGAAAVLKLESAAQVISSEAGHMTAAPSSADAQQVCERARALYGRASWERILCGEGLALFDAVARHADKLAAPAEVAARASVGNPPARRAVSAFAHALGEFAGDWCLAMRATGGAYLVGGVAQGLGPAFDTGAFRAGFETKGRLSAVLRDVPCYLILARDLAERGLARLLAGQVHAPFIEAGTQKP